jgi:hypothetical protein
MGALVVEFLNEGIELSLLLKEVALLVCGRDAPAEFA